jgi:hypothetical protein
MPIKPASEINWTPPPRCPVCNVGITASGQSMPVAVDDVGTVYCRAHGVRIEPTYPARLQEYHEWRQRRADAIAALEEAAQAEPRKTGSDGAE